MATEAVKAVEFLAVIQTLFPSLFFSYVNDHEFLNFECYSVFKVAYFKVRSWYSPGGTEESHEKPQSG
jgi:hypothetical protein